MSAGTDARRALVDKLAATAEAKGLTDGPEYQQRVLRISHMLAVYDLDATEEAVALLYAGVLLAQHYAPDDPEPMRQVKATAAALRRSEAGRP